MESLNSIGVLVSDEEAKAEAKRLLLGALDSPTESQAETLARQWIKQAMVIARARWSAQLEAATGLLRSAEALLDPSRGTGDVQVRYQLVVRPAT
jgi:hypothetical protein